MGTSILLLFFTATCVFVLTEAVPPCDTASEYVEALSGCFYGGTGILLASMQINTIYEAFPDAIKDQVLQHTNLTTRDEDGREGCDKGIDDMRECAAASFSACESSLRDSVDVSVNEFRGRYCEESNSGWQYSSLTKTYFDKIGQAFLQYFSDSATRDGVTPCVSDAIDSGIASGNGSCFESALNEDSALFMNTTSYADAKDDMASFYKAFINCIYQAMLDLDCGDDLSIGYLAYLVLFSTPPGVNYGFKQLDKLVGTPQEPTGKNRASVVVFGDPHIITFDGFDFGFHTCSSADAEVLYLKNNHVTIYGHNEPVTGAEGFTPPTYMTKVSVTFTHGTSPVTIYNFTGGESLPISFEQNDVGDEATVETTDNSVIRLVYSRGGIVVGIKKIGVTLAMTVRMEESLYVTATGLLTSGCPGEELNTNSARRKRAETSEVCVNLGLTGDKLEACDYDVRTDPDTSVVTGQYQSIAEMEAAAEELDDAIIVVGETTASSASRPLGHVTTVSLMLIGYTYFL